MWIGLADAVTGIGITNGQFSHTYANYGGGWYWVVVGPYTWLSARAPGYNEARVNTQNYDSFRLYLTRPSSGTKK